MGWQSGAEDIIPVWVSGMNCWAGIWSIKPTMRRTKFLSRLPEEVRLSADEGELVWRLLQLRKKGRLPKTRS